MGGRAVNGVALAADVGGSLLVAKRGLTTLRELGWDWSVSGSLILAGSADR